MAKNPKKQLDTIELEGELLNEVSYATYYCRLPLFTSFRIFNRGEENVSEINVSITGTTQLIMPKEIMIDEIPHESSMGLTVDNILNPKYLAEIDEPSPCTVKIKLTRGNTAICSLKTNDARPSHRLLERAFGQCGNAFGVRQTQACRLSENPCGSGLTAQNVGLLVGMDGLFGQR